MRRKQKEKRFYENHLDTKLRKKTSATFSSRQKLKVLNWIYKGYTASNAHQQHVNKLTGIKKQLTTEIINTECSNTVKIS